MAGGDAREVALRALGRRDVSARELDRRLAARGFAPSEREDALEALARTGLVDDARYARERASHLAARGAGDALIRHDLHAAGVAEELVEQALDALEPERERAEAVVARRGPGPRTARYLRGKGFAEDVVASVAAGPEDGVA